MADMEVTIQVRNGANTFDVTRSARDEGDLGAEGQQKVLRALLSEAVSYVNRAYGLEATYGVEGGDDGQ